MNETIEEYQARGGVITTITDQDVDDRTVEDVPALLWRERFFGGAGDWEDLVWKR